MLQLHMQPHTLFSKELMTIREFLGLYSISRKTFYNLVQAKAIKITKVGRRTLIKKIHAQEWLDSLQHKI